MAANGIINAEDIIPRCSTAMYPQEAATVAMRNVAYDKPWLSVHIRGKGQSKTNSYNNYTWNNADTMRVNFGHDYKGKSLSGELAQDLDFRMVDEAIKQIETAMKAQ